MKLLFRLITFVMTVGLFAGQVYAGGELGLIPSISFSEDYSHRCGLTLLTPPWLVNGCTGTIEDKEGVLLSFRYFRYNEERNDYVKRIEFGIYPENFQTFLKSGSRGMLQKSNDGEVVRSADGLPILKYTLNDCGQQPIRIDVTPISGSNWNGWMWEQIFPMPKKRPKNLKINPKCYDLDDANSCIKYNLTNRQCIKYTPEYRCVSLAFGNDKVSAVMAGSYCFLRKRVDNLDTELSFDVFMDMLHTLRFNEGEAVHQ